jgi:hypothetical protein
LTTSSRTSPALRGRTNAISVADVTKQTRTPRGAEPPPGGDSGGAAPPPPPPDAGVSFRQYAILVAAGAFATTFAQQRVLANYPTTFLLKDHLHMAKEDVAVFFFWATFAWNLKPLAGILTDAFPLFGTRRRSYMILGSLTAGVLWLVMGLFPDSYTSLLLASAGMNIATVFASTVMGAAPRVLAHDERA